MNIIKYIQWTLFQRKNMNTPGKAILLYGVSGSGKTSKALRCYHAALHLGWTSGGIIAPGTFIENKRMSFTIVDLHTNHSTLLAQRFVEQENIHSEIDSLYADTTQDNKTFSTPTTIDRNSIDTTIESKALQIGCFHFQNKGLALGRQAIQSAIERSVFLLIIDEIGPLECSEKGWATLLHTAVTKNIPNILVTVRPQLLSVISEKFFSSYICQYLSVADVEKYIDSWQHNGSTTP